MTSLCYLLRPSHIQPSCTWKKISRSALLIKTLLDDYVKQEVENFMNGQREITDTELAEFFADLEPMDIQEYLDAYTVACETY